MSSVQRSNIGAMDSKVCSPVLVPLDAPLRRPLPSLQARNTSPWVRRTNGADGQANAQSSGAYQVPHTPIADLMIQFSGESGAARRVELRTTKVSGP
jgi:hypothetical protein